MTIPTPPNWTKQQLTTLIHALALSPHDASSLLPYSQSQITSTIRTLSLLLDNPSSWTAPRHTRALLKHLTGLTPPTKPRRKKLPPPPKHRVSIQLIPATPNDDAVVRAVGAYPFVEVVLKPARRVWDIVRHLYSKWGLPVRVVKDNRDVAVDSLVVELLENGSRVVRVPYKVLKVDIDWSSLDSIFEQPHVNISGKKRILAPRDDDAFWTGAFSPVKQPNMEPHSPAAQSPARVNLQQNTANSFSHERQGEQAVLSRLRGHLERLERQEQQREQSNMSLPIAEHSQEDDDFAVIPEQFLTSCSRFDLAHSLPESLLSLGKSDQSRESEHDRKFNDTTKAQGIGGEAQTPVANNQDAGGNDGDGIAHSQQEENHVDVNALQVMNDALDLRHDLDLRCDEDLQGMDLFQSVDLGPVPAPTLSLSALFRE